MSLSQASRALLERPVIARDRGRHPPRRHDRARILGDILRPGGQQWDCYNVQLDLVSGDAALAVPGSADVLRRSAALRAKVSALLRQ